MTLQSQQWTQNYNPKKLGENVAIKAFILGWQKWQNQEFLTKLLAKSAILTNEKWHFGGKILWSLLIIYQVYT